MQYRLRPVDGSWGGIIVTQTRTKQTTIQSSSNKKIRRIWSVEREHLLHYLTKVTCACLSYNNLPLSNNHPARHFYMTFPVLLRNRKCYSSNIKLFHFYSTHPNTPSVNQPDRESCTRCLLGIKLTNSISLQILKSPLERKCNATCFQSKICFQLIFSALQTEPGDLHGAQQINSLTAGQGEKTNLTSFCSEQKKAWKTGPKSKLTEVGINSCGSWGVCVARRKQPVFPRLALALIKQQHSGGCFPLMAQQRWIIPEGRWAAVLRSFNHHHSHKKQNSHETCTNCFGKLVVDSWT